MSSNNSNESSPTNSISLIKLDELSSFGATKQSRLPALIKLNTIDQNTQQQQQQLAPNSMPDFSGSQLEKGQEVVAGQQQQQQRSLPVELSKQKVVVAGDKIMPENNQQVSVQQQQQQQADKENISMQEQQQQQEEQLVDAADESDDFQVVDMQQGDESTGDILIGPSLPQVSSKDQQQQQQQISKDQIDKSINALQSSLQLGQSTHLGDSLIEMIINLRNENQNLIRALETNNEYVKERLSEFKRIQEDSKKREAQFAIEKADFEHQIRKLNRQNTVLSERLKSMEAKLKDMKLEVSESLVAAHSSKASSIQENNEPTANLYPLIDSEANSFGNEALAAASANARSAADEDDDPHQATTMQVDATSGELYNQDDQQSTVSSKMDTDQNGPSAAANYSAMSKEELSKHFDAKKVEFYALDDPMKQCDKLEQQLNNIGKRDYEICLLQQQLNIYRQDFRLERMEKLEAKIQIEKLKNDIDRLCLERLQQSASSGDEQQQQQYYSSSGRRISDGLGKFGHHLTKKAAKQAAKAAKYAAKQAHLEEKAAAALARVAAARASTTATTTSTSNTNNVPSGPGPQQTIPKYGINDQQQSSNSSHHHHHHGRHSHHRHHSSSGGGGAGSTRPARGSGIRSEVVNDLLSTANKAMLTGYKMASTHVNLALDKLSQYEQQQASQLDKNKQTAAAGATQATGVVGAVGKQQPASGSAPSAPLEYPSID